MMTEMPSKTIGFTLKKFKIAKNAEDQTEMSKKYRVYRVREDPKTRYRYVTEILNQEEGIQLINKKNCQILICHYSLVKNPQEDFKNLLDEAERKQIRLAEEKNEKCDEKKEKDASDNDEPKKEPATQSSAPSQPSQPSSSGPSSDKSSVGSASKVLKNYTKKRLSGQKDPSPDVFDASELLKFKAKYPRIEICGKTDELYKCSDVLTFVKDTSQIAFDNFSHMTQKLLKPMHEKH